MLHKQYYADKLRFLTCLLLRKVFICHTSWRHAGNVEYIEDREYEIDYILATYSWSGRLSYIRCNKKKSIIFPFNFMQK